MNEDERGLTPEQRALADLMSDLSEEAFCAGWMHGLEHSAWEIAHGRIDSYGNLGKASLDAYRGDLLRLSSACGGWIVWWEGEHDEGEMWVPLADWEPLHEQYTSERSRR